MDLLLILLLILVGLAVYRLWPVLRAISHITSLQREAQRRYQEQQDHQRATERADNPPQKSEDLIKGANLDLNGGEYVDYEEITDSKQ